MTELSDHPPHQHQVQQPIYLPSSNADSLISVKFYFSYVTFHGTTVVEVQSSESLQLVCIREAIKKKYGQSWDFVPTGGREVYPHC